MERQQSNNHPRPTIWKILDDAWPMLQAMLNEHSPAKPNGHRRVDLRRVLNGILFRLRTGGQWGTSCRHRSTMTARGIGTFSTDVNRALSRDSGRRWSRSAPR
jgi:hypothetical protein